MIKKLSHAGKQSQSAKAVKSGKSRASVKKSSSKKPVVKNVKAVSKKPIKKTANLKPSQAANKNKKPFKKNAPNLKSKNVKKTVSKTTNLATSQKSKSKVAKKAIASKKIAKKIVKNPVVKKTTTKKVITSKSKNKLVKSSVKKSTPASKAKQKGVISTNKKMLNKTKIKLKTQAKAKVQTKANIKLTPSKNKKIIEKKKLPEKKVLAKKNINSSINKTLKQKTAVVKPAPKEPVKNNKLPIQPKGKSQNMRIQNNDIISMARSTNVHDHYLSPDQLAHFQKRLLEWKNDLMTGVDNTIHHMQNEYANLADPNDRATQEEEFSLELRTRDRERKLMAKIDESLKQIEAGEYGYCGECGIEIGVERLNARLTATLCIDCKTLDEIREKQIAD